MSDPQYDEHGRLIYVDTPPTPEELVGNSIGYCYMRQDVLDLRPLERLHDHQQ